MSRTRAVLVATLAALPACPPPSSFGIVSATDDLPETGTGPAPTPTTGEEPLPTTTAPPETTGSTGLPADTTTAGLPEPHIVSVEFDPDPLAVPGPIAVTVHTEHTDAVSLAVDNGDAIELDPAGPDVFTTELYYYSSQANGAHSADFVPWLEGQAGPPHHAEFEVALPTGGGEVFWEATPALGKGRVAAVAVLPGGSVVEFGTLLEGTSRCYLRRRTPAGAWDIKKDVQQLSFTPCTAIDLGIGPDGELYLLADREGSWWLGSSATFGVPPLNLRWGSPGEKAYALAMHPKKVAVCGTQPTPKTDVRAMAWIYGIKDDPGGTLPFDYVSGNEKLVYDEIPRDCMFRQDVLVLAGIINGQHDTEDPNAPALDRLFILESDPSLPQPDWTIDGAPKDLTQSGAQALALDSQGQTIIGGYSCGMPCGKPTSELRVYKPGGALTWMMKLAPDVAPPVALAWSPAGYVVLVSALQLGNWSASFFVQAWKPGQYPALWSYSKNVAPTLHFATSVAIGPFGQVYTGGSGSDGYPAVAFINP